MILCHISRILKKSFLVPKLSYSMNVLHLSFIFSFDIKCNITKIKQDVFFETSSVEIY